VHHHLEGQSERDEVPPDEIPAGEERVPIDRGEEEGEEDGREDRKRDSYR
jgi:hypothetical protein